MVSSVDAFPKYSKAGIVLFIKNEKARLTGHKTFYFDVFQEVFLHANATAVAWEAW